MKKMKLFSKVPIALVGAILMGLMIALIPVSQAEATPILQLNGAGEAMGAALCIPLYFEGLVTG
jgi:hypothetical protein